MSYGPSLLIRPHWISCLVLALIGPLLCAGESAFALPSKSQREGDVRDFRLRMRRVATAFEKIHALSASAERFSDAQNEKTIGKALEGLQREFRSIPVAAGAEPGFDASLLTMRDVLTDAKDRFDAGNKSYARWRLQSLGSYCVSCHARWSFGQAFSDEEPSYISGLSDFERSEYLLATRKFNQARDLFYQVVLDASQSEVRMEALRRWLLIQVRHFSDPSAALSKLLEVSSSVEFVDAHQREINAWVRSLRRWMNEDTGGISAFRRAQNLFRQAELRRGDGVGDVELLRASSILHRLLSGSEASTEKAPEKDFSQAQGLLLLGKAYEELSLFFAPEVPEFYYERCIREFPGTQAAKSAYVRLYNLAVIGYTGSVGLSLPTEVAEKFKQLHLLAHRESE